MASRRAEPMRARATGAISRDQDYRRPLQPRLAGKLSRTDRHDVGLCRRLGAVVHDGRAAARRMDEPASGRTAGRLALRDRSTDRPGRLRAAYGAHRGLRTRRRPPRCQRRSSRHRCEGAAYRACDHDLTASYFRLAAQKADARRAHARSYRGLVLLQVGTALVTPTDGQL